MSRRPRPPARLVVVALLSVAALASTATAASAQRRPDPRHLDGVVAHPRSAGGPVQLGGMTLHPCAVTARALCGTVERLWEPADPSAGEVRVGFAFVPARDTSRPALGTVVPHEGGPGYSTTGTGESYAQMYGPLLGRRNLLLVDQRGTGLSKPVSCPALQDLTIAYRVAAGRCGRALGARADDYTTARSADDLAAVVRRLGLGPVDVYGDSYGTFFAQVFTGRHPRLVRSLVLDSAYPTYGESAWYPTQGPAMRRAFDLVCRRSAPCREAGRPFVPTLRRVLRIVRTRPWTGVSHDADGVRARVSVDGPTLVAVAFGATYTPAFYREMTAALRSGLQGDRAPLLRLVAEALGGGTDAGDPVDYSEGLDAAVACHDYPQLYDMTAPPGAVRERQYANALDERTRRHPGTYGPFTVREYAASDWQELDWCTRWPVAPRSNPAAPPRPRGGHYPRLPVLVLSGELDSITTAAEGRLVARQFPDARQVLVANSFHVTAVGDVDDCAQRLVRAFVESPGSTGRRLRACARRVEPVRAPGIFAQRLTDLRPARSPRPVPLAIRRTGPAAAATVADLQDRWWNNYSGKGFGLRGGTWTYAGDDTVVFDLTAVRLLAGTAVSGRAVWDRYGERMDVDLRVRGSGPHGRLRGHWDTRRTGATAALAGVLDGRSVRLTFRAP
jgi:pimeloyl-ACP methyl ester carboxylesterase